LLVFSISCLHAPLGGREEASSPAAPADTVLGLGTVRGVVRNADQGDAPVEGAQVQVLDTGLETTTAADGSFTIPEVPAGRRRLQVSKGGLSPARTEVDVTDGETTEVPAILLVAPPEDALPAEEAAEVMVVTLRVQRGELIAVKEKVTGVGVQEVIKRDAFKFTAKGDVGGLVQELPGVHTVDSKFAYVRGLGERYSQTLLNNSLIPSPEPDKRVIPLDLFPASVVGSIAVVKTYSPDFPGEFSGGSVQIATVEVPAADFVNAGVDFKYRHGTTFRDFQTYHGGNWDKFSFDDGTRALPDEVPPTRIPGLLTPEQVQDVGRSFPNIWDPATVTAPLDHKLGLSFGKRIDTGGDSSVGIVGALNWANKYQTIKDETRNIVANAGTPENPVPFEFSSFKLDSSTFEAELSGLLNVTWDLNPGQTLGIRNLYTRSAEDEVRHQTGMDGQRNDGPIDISRLRWVERSLFSTQPFGEHLLSNDHLVEWRVSYALSQRDEPDNRQVRYLFDPNRNDFFFEDVAGSGRRDFYVLDENIYDGALDYSIPFNPFDVPDQDESLDRKVPEQRIKFGPAAVFRDRDFDGRKFRFRPLEPGEAFDENGRPIDLAASPEELFKDPNINPRGFRLVEDTLATDSYDAEQTLLAGYGLFDFRIVESLRLQAGARVEYSSQTITSELESGAESETELVNTDPLPAFNLTWEFARVPLREPTVRTVTDTGEYRQPPVEEFWRVFEDRENSRDGLMQLRLAASQTVSRPEFRELAEFQYTDIGGITAQGNPDLQRAKVWNADLGWIWFWGPGELLAAGVFYKHLIEPIEVVNLATASGILTTWDNADKADLFGLELEARKNFDFIPALFGGSEKLQEDFRNFSLITNFSWIDSEVTIKDDPTSQQTNDKRPLQGQSEYLFNAGIIYDLKKEGFSVAVLVNSFGERISAVGASGIDDEIEQPRWDVSFSITKTFGKWALKLSGENLLNYKYEYEQSGLTTREYTKGLAIGLGISYSF
jgi:outer membrane receptor protein involved in Fe transport